MAKKIARRAVSPVLATLMMVAVAVALSVIIFTWSQGFLSQTGEAASGQQAAQNIAAQSGILIESATFSSSSGTVVVRNVGKVSVTIDSYYLTQTRGATTASTRGPTTLSLDPGVANTISISPLVGSPASFTSGDIVTIKVTTTAGTFAQATYIVP
jgi:flagellin-like protein